MARSPERGRGLLVFDYLGGATGSVLFGLPEHELPWACPSTWFLRGLSDVAVAFASIEPPMGDQPV